MEHIIISSTEDSAAGEFHIKTMLIAFFDIDGLVHHEFVPTGQTVNKELYKTVLRRLRDAVRRHRPEKWRSGNWILHHDNAPAHRVVTTNGFLAKHNIPSLPQPPHSPDLAPCDFFLFPQLKKTMKGRRFNYVEDIQANATIQLGLLQKVTTRGAFVSGRSAGISAYKHKDTILKETRPTSR